MMPWWSWVLIWSGLGVILLVTLGLFAWWLFRKFLVLLDDLAGLADRASLLETADSELVRPQLAVLAEVREVQARESARRFHRTERRRLRRQSRLDRARRITSADASAIQWPADWYR